MNSENKKQYYAEYYQKHKTRIAERNKKKYLEQRTNPILTDELKKRCAEATRRYRERHPNRVKESRKAQYYRRRKTLMDMLGGAICNRCGCSEPSFLEINHINGGGCQEVRSIGNRIVDDVLGGRRQTDDLEVLCRVCNALDYLERVNPVSAEQYVVTWETLTGREGGA